MNRLLRFLLVGAVLTTLAAAPAAAQQCPDEYHMADLGRTPQVQILACFPQTRGLGHWNLFLGVRNLTGNRLTVQFTYDVTLANGRVDSRRAHVQLPPNEFRGGGNFTGVLSLSAHYQEREEQPRRISIQDLRVQDHDAEERERQDRRAQTEREQAAGEQRRQQTEAAEGQRREREQRERQEGERREQARAEREQRERTRLEERQGELQRREQERREREEARQRAEAERRRQVEESEREVRQTRLANAEAHQTAMTSFAGNLIGLAGSDSEYRGLSFRFRLGLGGGFSMFPVVTNSSGTGRSSSSGTGFGMGLGPTLDIDFWPIHSDIIAASLFVSGHVGGVSTGEASSYMTELRMGGRLVIGTPWIGFVGEYSQLLRAGGWESSMVILGMRSVTTGSGDYRMERVGAGLKICFSVSSRSFCQASLMLLALAEHTDIALAANRGTWGIGAVVDVVQAVRIRAEFAWNQHAPGEIRYGADGYPQDVAFQVHATRSWDWFGDSFMSSDR